MHQPQVKMAQSQQQFLTQSEKEFGKNIGTYHIDHHKIIGANVSKEEAT